MNLSPQRISVEQKFIDTGSIETDNTIQNLTDVLNNMKSVNDAMMEGMVGESYSNFISARETLEIQVEQVCTILYGVTGELRWYANKTRSAREQALTALGGRDN